MGQVVGQTWLQLKRHRSYQKITRMRLMNCGHLIVSMRGELHIRFGPEITMSIWPGNKLCRAMLLHVAGVWTSAHGLFTCSGQLTPDTSTHSIVSPSFRGLETSETSPVRPSGPNR